MEELAQVKEKIKDFILELDDKKTIELFDYLAFGKMLRAKLIFKIAGFNKTSLELSAIIEMIHAASLLHDDVIDEADTRRGQESINSKYDNKTAIMFGDILYSKAFSKLALLNQEIANIVANAVSLLSMGELQDVELSKKFNNSYDLYLEMIYNKTASLIEASAKSAAILAKKNIENFALYGKNLGLAFQMIDDILDITQDSQTLGKPALLDFVEGKVTIPYLLLWQRLENEEDKKRLEKLFKKPLEFKEQTWIKQKMQTSKALADSINLAKKLGLEAKEAIKDEPNAKDLSEIILAMIDRDF